MLAIVVIAALPLVFSPVVSVHDFYTGQQSPQADKGSCCNDVDCAPREVRLNAETGELEIQINGRWWLVTDPHWYLGSSPDGSAHGCMMPRDVIPRCVWLGMGT